MYFRNGSFSLAEKSVDEFAFLSIFAELEKCRFIMWKLEQSVSQLKEYNLFLT